MQQQQEAHKRAIKHVVDSWQERLQLISVIVGGLHRCTLCQRLSCLQTTFFASVEAGLLVNGMPANPSDMRNNLLKSSNAGFLGGLIMHVFAGTVLNVLYDHTCSRYPIAILSFVAAFMLNEYKLETATYEELILEGMTGTTGFRGFFRKKDLEHGLQALATEKEPASATLVGQTTPNATTKGSDRGSQELRHQTVDPVAHLEDVSLQWAQSRSVALFRNIHALCIVLACIGFVFTITGIVLYAWAVQPWEVGVVTSVCFGACVLAVALSIITTIYRAKARV